jgi:hypothetical protein
MKTLMQKVDDHQRLSPFQDRGHLIPQERV